MADGVTARMADTEMEANPTIPRSEADLEAELERLRQTVSGGARLMNHAVWVDVDEFEERMDQIRQQLPREVKRARRVVQEEQRILGDASAESERLRTEAAAEAQRVLGDSTAEAQRLLETARAEAENLLSAARAEAARLVHENTIRRMAEEQAQQLLDQAHDNAIQIGEGAYAYARDLLSRLELTVGDITESINQGKAQLQPPPSQPQHAE